MSLITAELSSDGRALTIRITGRFDFSSHKEFRHAYCDLDQVPSSVVLDLSSTEYLDSSALGMILILKEHLGEDKNRIELRNANPTVSNILEVANFDKLLEVSCA